VIKEKVIDFFRLMRGGNNPPSLFYCPAGFANHFSGGASFYGPVATTYLMVMA